MDSNISTRSQLYWNTFVQIPSQVISFIISIIVARTLDPKDFGIMGIAMMLIGYSNQFTNFGFNAAIIQKRIYEKRILDSIFTFDLFVSSLLASIFFILSSYIADFFKAPECKEVLRVMSLVFVITSFTSIPSAILKRDMDFKSVALFDLAKSLLMAFITLILALNNFGYWALAYGQLIPLIVITISLCIKTRWTPVIHYKYSLMKGIINFGTWNFINSQLLFIAQHTDKFITGRWLGPISLGFYDKAKSIAEMPYNSFIMNINGVMFSSFSRANDDKNQVQKHFKKSLTLLSFISFPIYFGGIVIAPYFVSSILGSKWSRMLLPFQVILAGMLLQSFCGITASLTVGIGKYKDTTIFFFVSLISYILFCFLLLRFNIVGIAVSYLFFNVIQVYLLMNISLRNIDLSWRDVYFAILPGAAAATLMFLAAKIMAHFIFVDYSLINMLLIIVISASVYSMFILLDKSQLTKEFKDLAWNDFKNKISLIHIRTWSWL